MDALCRKIDQYVDLGLCSVCAIKLACFEHNVAYEKAASLWAQRLLHRVGETDG